MIVKVPVTPSVQLLEKTFFWSSKSVKVSFKACYLASVFVTYFFWQEL